MIPAVATTIYTVSTINNAFESELNPLIGFLDSHVSFDLSKHTTYLGHEHVTLNLLVELAT
jgi:hypothetical protein